MSTSSTPKAADHPHTSDGRCFVVRGRLWRLSEPALAPEQREQLVHDLMEARRSLTAGVTSPAARAKSRKWVDDLKSALGERGPVWWTDGAPDYNRRRAKNTPYADWYVGADAYLSPAPGLR